MILIMKMYRELKLKNMEFSITVNKTYAEIFVLLPTNNNYITNLLIRYIGKF